MKDKNDILKITELSPGTKFDQDEQQLIIAIENLTKLSYPEKVTKTRDTVTNALLTTEPTSTDLKKKEYSVALSTTLKEVPSKVVLTYNNLSNIVITGDEKPFNFFDKMVLEAIVSLYLNGNNILTASSIYKVMLGKTSNVSGERYNPSSEKLEKVADSVRKMRFLDVSFEVEGGSKGSLTFSGNMLNADEGLYKSKGKKVQGFLIKGAPIIYSYAQLQNQISEIPLYVCDVPLNMTDETLMLREYISNEIEMSKTEGLKEAFIDCSKIHDLIYGTELSQKKKNKIKSQIRIILDYWKDINHISDYRKKQQGNSIIGYIVTV